MDKQMIGMCGTYCGVCEWKEKTNCPGCQICQGKPFWGECSIAKCSINNKYNHCGHCPNMPCDELQDAFNNEEHGDNGERLINLKNWSSGKETYLKLRTLKINNKPSEVKKACLLTKYNLTQNEMCALIEDGLVDYVKIVSENGNRPFVLNDKIGWVKTFEACLFENLIHNPNFKFYLAFLNGEPVASSMLQLSKVAASIDMVSTLREYWHKGIGTAMTKTPLLYAKDKGYKIGVLQASEAGEHGYRKIGFEEYCRFNVYAYQK